MNKTFPASLEKLKEMLVFVQSQAKLVGFDDVQISKIELASEEALVNIISYGYPDASGKIDIHCSAPNNSGIKIIIKDDGIPYNPLDKSINIDRKKTAEHQVIGGYGIFFIRNIMDEVDYCRHNQHNVLTLVKYL